MAIKLLCILLFIILDSNNNLNNLLSQTHVIDSYSENVYVTLFQSIIHDNPLAEILLGDVQYHQTKEVSTYENETKYTLNLESSLVNIFCIHNGNNKTRTTTGSGFFIEPSGIIMTNAHVAQFFLLTDLENYIKTTCTIQTGNPTKNKFIAELLYIPPSWVLNNTTSISESRPSGTGEHDYALLYVKKSYNNEPLPTHFPSLEIDTTPLTIENISNIVSLAGYPSNNKITAKNSLSKSKQVILEGKITEIFTFSRNLADLITIDGLKLAEHGLSGGPVFNNRGHVIGMVTTKGENKQKRTDSIRAITMPYIEQNLIQETGLSLKEYKSSNLNARSKIFHKTLVPFYQAILLEEWNKSFLLFPALGI